MIPFLLVWLRAAGLLGQSAAVGGAAFSLVVLRPARDRCPRGALDWILTLTALGAVLAAIAQASAFFALAAALADDGEWPLAALLGSTSGIAGLTRVAAAAAAAAMALACRRAPESRLRGAMLLGVTLLLAFTGALAGHGAGRLEGRSWLVSLDALHQAAAGAWVGGLICAVVVASRAKRYPPEDWLRRFSGLAAAAVSVLALSGAALSIHLIATPAAAIGTSYGAMVLTKIALFAALLAMGALNFRALRDPRRERPPSAPPVGSVILPRRLEVEAGLAVVTVLLAASIGSAPPAVDVGTERATLAEVERIFTPRWPRLSAPSLAELDASSGLGDASAPHTAEETAWSEFGHNVAGLFVLAMGLLAMLERSGRARWARHWPLLFVGLTGFVAWNMDPEGWQTGRIGFWAQLQSVEVLQHRLLLAVTAFLGLAEWRVHSGRDPASRWRHVFAVLCIAAGALLLTHDHDVSNAKSAFLMEITHLPLALIVLVAGWARWLELRLPSPENRAPGRLWAPALALFGLLLIFYREG